jgi:hypothetical protein
MPCLAAHQMSIEVNGRAVYVLRYAGKSLQVLMKAHPDPAARQVIITTSTLLASVLSIIYEVQCLVSVQEAGRLCCTAVHMCAVWHQCCCAGR